MKACRVALVLLVALGTISISASGPLGIYGIVEKVVFEPNEKDAERIQVWGAFAYAVRSPLEGAEVHVQPAQRGSGVSPVRRGYLYFKLRSSIPGFTTDAQVELIKKEWADLKSVAGTGQAVGFSRYDYIGAFDSIRPDAEVVPKVVFETKPQGGLQADLRVRPASEVPANPVTYQTDAGVVKLSAQGSLAVLVKELREAVKK